MSTAAALLRELEPHFIPPEKTRARQTFGGFDAYRSSFKEARVVVFGVPFEGTATYGGGSHLGPWAIRDVTGNQLEPNIFEAPVNFDPYRDVGIYDLGDFDFRSARVRGRDRHLIYDIIHPSIRATEKEIADAKSRVNKAIERLSFLEYVTQRLREEGKIPLMLGGEHLVSLWPLKAVSGEKPVVLQFDAHMDMKAEYLGVTLSHTTFMYHVTHGDKAIPTNDLIQIGVRQASPDEFENAMHNKAYDPDKAVNIVSALEISNEGAVESLDVYKGQDIIGLARGRNVYITFDIDVLDIPFVPHTGTPEPFGITPLEAYNLIASIPLDARIIGIDMMEVSSDGKSTREGVVAAHLIYRMLTHPSFRR